MSTDKCPKCGKPLHWSESCGRQDAFCSCCWMPDDTKDMGRYPATRLFPVSDGLIHRIRELEARNARLTEALMRVQEMAHNASSGPMELDTYWDIRTIAQEALKR